MLTPLDRLRLFLRPPGKGLYTHSTGGGYATSVLLKLFGTHAKADVAVLWDESLQRIRRARTIVMGIPSDTGAGIVRGANLGPIGIRQAYFESIGTYPKDVLDCGDVICIPQLLHDEMLSEIQINSSRAALYPDVDEGLPVSPLSIAEQAIQDIVELNPKAKVILLGGDHSVSWPAIIGCASRFGKDFGVLHFDAHTDLLDSRLGVRYCFATWAFHTLGLLKPRALVQVGLRTSLKNKEFWEQHLPVKQFWAPEILGNPARALDTILEYLRSLKLSHLYISNDIDGTDRLEAPATGTPEGGGLHAEWVLKLLELVKKEFDIVGGDIVEVAPPLSGTGEFGRERTCLLGARYLHSVIS